MGARSKARKRALDVLYVSDLLDTDALTTLADRTAGRDPDSPPVSEYAADLVAGVVAHRDRLDELLQTYAEGWTLDRMPTVDRNVLRIGAYELLYVDDVPDGVAIDEAVELARTLSTEASPGFVNGILARLLSLKPHLSL